MPEAPSITPPQPAAAPSPASPAPGAPQSVQAELTTPQGNGSDPGDPFAAIDALGREEGTPAPAPAPKQNGSKPRGEDGKFKPGEDKSKPEPDKSVPDKAPDKNGEQQAQPKASELRRLKDQFESENKSLKAELEKLRTAKPPDDPEKAQLAQNLAAREKRVAELEAKHQELDQELRFAAFERSSEYKDKYEAPFVSAWADGAKLMTEFTVVKKVDDEGNVTREERPATAKDFEALMSINKAGDAAKFVHDLFGSESGAGELLSERRRIILLNQSREKAIEDHRKMGGERHAAQQKQWADGESARAKHFDQSRDAGAEKYPKWFKDDPNDPQGNEMLARGKHLADRAFSNGQPLKDGDKQLNPQELTAVQAAMYNKAAGFDRLAHRHNAMSKELAQVKAKLAEYEKSTPTLDAGDGRGKASPSAEATAEGAFNRVFGSGS